MEKATVPKFGSFKPKQSTKPAPPKDGQIEDHDKPERRHRDSKYDRKHRESRDSRDHEHRHRQDKLQKYHSRDKHRHREHRRKSPSPEPAIAQDEFDESSLYIVDRRGDSKNITYGSLHRYSIPAYRTVGYGNVIGASLSAKIDRDQSNEKEIVLQSAERRMRHAAPRPLASKQARPSDQHLRSVAADASKGEEPPQADFIDLKPSRKRKRDPDFSAADLAAAASVDYRSIEGKAKQPSQPEDDDLTFASESDSNDADEDASLRYRQENAVLSKRAKADPANWEPWLTLVKHQANLVRPGVAAASFTTSERRTLADLRLSILHEASRHISKNSTGYEDLRLATIEEGRHLWDNGKLQTKWKEALGDCPESTLLWTKYLDHIQHDHTSLRYESCRDAYLRCSQMLKEARRKEKYLSHSIAEVQAFVLLRLTRFVRDAGYAELFIAIWQAIVEYQIFRPTTIDEADELGLLTSFEDFWESEEPRIGEAGAKGWADYAAGNTNSRRNPTTPTVLTLESGNQLANFAEEEARLSGFILPTTMDDEDATADPFRCVMFDDIRDILSNLSMVLPKRLLVQGFLAYMGLPTLPIKQGEFDSRLWLLDQHIPAGNPDGHSAAGAYDSAITGFSYHIQMTIILFTNAFDAFARQQKSDTEDRALFIDRLLSSLIYNDPQDEVLAEYYLAFKLHLFPDQAAKAAKRLLKARPSSLRLYNAYALMQAKLSGPDQALGVWTLALKMGGDDAVLLWCSRLLAQVKAGDEVGALRTLLTLSGGEGGSDDRIQRLKTTRLLEDAIDRSLLQQNFENVALGADCLAWLEYLANSHDLTSAIRVYDKYTHRLLRKASMLALESLHQAKCFLFSHHIDCRRAYKPALLRSELEASVRQFPNNTILLELHRKIAAQDRLRAMFRDRKSMDEEAKSIIQWSHQLSTEIQHLHNGTAGATINSVRAGFNKALLGIDSQVAHSSALWFAWLQFEHEQGSMSRIKQLFLDGMRYLPWHKHWIITGMNMLLKGGMGRSELRQVYETMVERGLRIRMEVEDT